MPEPDNTLETIKALRRNRVFDEMFGQMLRRHDELAGKLLKANFEGGRWTETQAAYDELSRWLGNTRHPGGVEKGYLEKLEAGLRTSKSKKAEDTHQSFGD